jgi:uncharacterized FlgJ-related protein
MSVKTLFAPDLPEVSEKHKHLNKERIMRLDFLMSVDFSPENLKALLFLLDAPSPDIIYNQARLETANFTSRVFKQANNLFGMHSPRIRENLTSGYIIADNRRKVAKYNKWQDSVLDIMLYFEYYEDLGYNTTDYYTFLRKVGYCEKDSYVNILKSMT